MLKGVLAYGIQLALMKTPRRLVAEFLSRNFPKFYLDLRIWQRNRNFEQEFWLIPLFCKKGGVSIDVGGNQGHFAFYMAKFSRSVHCFEPNKDCVERMARIMPKNVLVHQIALSESSGECQLRVPIGNDGVGTIEPENDLTQYDLSAGLVVLNIMTRTLDSFELRNIDFIKVDVEGHERSLLLGGIETLRKTSATILVEAEERHKKGSVRWVKEFLEELGYQGYFIQGGNSYHVAAFVPEMQYLTKIEIHGANSDHYVNNFVYIHQDRNNLLKAFLEVFPPA